MKHISLAALLLLALPAHANGWLDTMILCNQVQKSDLFLVCQAERKENIPVITFGTTTDEWNRNQNMFASVLAEVTVPVCSNEDAVILVMLFKDRNLQSTPAMVSFVCKDGTLIPVEGGTKS